MAVVVGAVAGFLLLLASTPEIFEADAGFPGGGTKPPVFGDDDMAAILTPVLLTGFAGESFAFVSSFSCPSFFACCFFDLELLFDFEEEVVEVDLSSLALLAVSFIEA